MCSSTCQMFLLRGDPLLTRPSPPPMIRGLSEARRNPALRLVGTTSKTRCHCLWFAWQGSTKGEGLRSQMQALENLCRLSKIFYASLKVLYGKECLLSIHDTRSRLESKDWKMNVITHLLSGSSGKRGAHPPPPGVLSAVKAQRGRHGNRAGAPEQPGAQGGKWRKLLTGAKLRSRSQAGAGRSRGL